MKQGRLLKFQPRQYLIVGRDDDENKALEKYYQYVPYISGCIDLVEKEDLPGPTILILDFNKLTD